ncbi:hypothetical protein PybrP1_001704 [[Pythium] brassicae (nom. inval.)]|nr:hypothetical protein PybrP1_001704 [[Pythium] brassicae (nom. inval.)]
MVRAIKFAIVFAAASVACASAGSYSFSSTDVSQNDNAVVKPADPFVAGGGNDGKGKPTAPPAGDSSTFINKSPASGNDSPVQKEITPAPAPSKAPVTPTTDSSTKATQPPPATPAKPAATSTQAPTPVQTSTSKTNDTTPKATPAATSTGKSTGSAPSATPASTSTGTGKTKPPCPTLPQPGMKTKPPCPTLPQPNLPAATPAASKTRAASTETQSVLEANTKSAATRVVPALAAVVVSAVYLLL